MTDQIRSPVIPVFSPFPAESFTITADPAMIRSSVEPYRRFATVAADAVENLATLSVDSWVGAEGDLYRERRTAFSPTMARAQGTYATVCSQLLQFADTVEALKRRMDALRGTAEATYRAGVSDHAAGDAISRGSITLDAGYTGPEQQWLQHLTEVRAIHAELLAASTATAAAIAAAPPPPPIPEVSALAGSAETHDLLPPVVTHRWTGDLKGAATIVSLLGKAGIQAQLEELDNGRVVVRILEDAGAGAAVAAGAGGGVKTGDGKMGASAQVGAEVSAALVVGTVHEMDRDEVAPFLTGLLNPENPAPTAPAAESVEGFLVGGRVRGSVNGEVGVSPIAGLGAEGEFEASVMGEFRNDGSTVTTLSLAASVEGGEKSDPLIQPGLEKVPEVRGWSPEKIIGADDLTGVETAAVGVAAAGAWTLRTRPDGSATLERSVRVQKSDEDRLHERQSIRVVSREEAAAINADLRNKNVQGATDKLLAIAKDEEGPDTETRDLVYEVKGEREFGVGGSAAAGAKTAAEASAGYREEELVSVNGVAR